jgi:anti-anti-sigma factor
MEPAAAHEVATRLPVTVHERGVVTVVGVGGELDAWTAPALCERIEECLQAGAPSLLLDLSELQACDEPALRALAGAVHEARAHEARPAAVPAGRRARLRRRPRAAAGRGRRPGPA